MKKDILFGLSGLVIGALVSGLIVASNKQPSTDQTAMNDLTENLRGKSGNDFDREFLSSMVKHHQDAVDMANLAKQHAGHNELKTMADDIINAQTREIDQMKVWQIQWNLRPNMGGGM